MPLAMRLVTYPSAHAAVLLTSLAVSCSPPPRSSSLTRAVGATGNDHSRRGKGQHRFRASDGRWRYRRGVHQVDQGATVDYIKNDRWSTESAEATVRGGKRVKGKDVISYRHDMISVLRTLIMANRASYECLDRRSESRYLVNL